MPAVALEQPRRGVKQEREQQALGLGEIEGALEGTPDSARVPERVAGDRLKQPSLNYPETSVHQRSGAIDDRRERHRRCLRIVLGEPKYRLGVAHLCAVALQPVHPGQGLFNALRFAHPHERLQHV